MNNNSTFIRLIKLFGRITTKTPLEDFSTEILVGILNSNTNYANYFFYKILNLPTDQYSIESQVSYFEEDGNKSIVDIVVSSSLSLIFIECKVDSPFNEEQLVRYNRILESGNQRDSTNKKLYYLTKSIYSDVALSELNVIPLHWHTIGSSLFNKFQNDTLINEFYNYLKEKDMAIDPEITAFDVASMNNIQRVINFCEQLFKSCDPAFEKTFASAETTNDARRYKSLKDEQFANIITNVSSGEGHSNFFYALRFEGFLVIQVFVSNDFSYFNEFKTFADQNSRNESWQSGNYESGYYLKKVINLGSFINDKNALITAEKWFKSGFLELAELINSNETIPWKDYIKTNISKRLKVKQDCVQLNQSVN